MLRLPTLLALAAALVVTPAATAGAQETLTPRPISADDPSAQRARAVADLVLAGDRQKLEGYLKEHAAPSYVSGSTFASELTELLDGVKTGARTIGRLDGLANVGVGVALTKAAGGQLERAIVVRMEKEAPHRISGLSLVPIGGAPPGE